MVENVTEIMGIRNTEVFPQFFGIPQQSHNIGLYLQFIMEVVAFHEMQFDQSVWMDFSFVPHKALYKDDVVQSLILKNEIAYTPAFTFHIGFEIA